MEWRWDKFLGTAHLALGICSGALQINRAGCYGELEGCRGRSLYLWRTSVLCWSGWDPTQKQWFERLTLGSVLADDFLALPQASWPDTYRSCFWNSLYSTVPPWHSPADSPLWYAQTVVFMLGITGSQAECWPCPRHSRVPQSLSHTSQSHTKVEQ